jgi:valyl-tRNA synthetase
VAENETAAYEAYAEANKLTVTDARNSLPALRQDEDCLDTWFSSWLWPFEVFKGYSNPGNAEVNYYYPTNTLVTAPEIIFFWVARMIMAGVEYMEQKPFQEVYFTGIVRDKLGRKMSKSLGNSPDLLGLIDTYGADAVRFGIMVSSPAGNDLMFDESALEQGRNFNNKIWNALKLIRMWEARKADQPEQAKEVEFAVDWFAVRLNQVRLEVDELMQQFKLSEALKTIYSLVWDDFCSWYLEWVKPGFEQPMDQQVYEKTIGYFESLMQLLHPFVPFITEEIFHLLRKQEVDLCIAVAQPAQNTVDTSLLTAGQSLKNLISAIRDGRNKNQLKPKDTIELFVQTAKPEMYNRFEKILSKQVNATAFKLTQDAVDSAIVVVVEKDSCYLLTEKKLDTTTLKADLLKDLAYQQNFLQSVEKKLSNEKFVANAKPEVVALERKKMEDAMQRIKTIEDSLASLN